MRRKDRQVDERRAYEILKEGEYATISMIDEEGGVYGVPISFVYQEGKIFFHGAYEGKKVNAWKKNPRVCLSTVTGVRVPGAITPDEYKETKEMVGHIGKLLSTHFTTEYSSAIVFGAIKEVTDDEEKKRALRAICEKYTPFNQEYQEEAIESSFHKTAVYSMEIEEITGKQKCLKRF